MSIRKIFPGLFISALFVTVLVACGGGGITLVDGAVGVGDGKNEKKKVKTLESEAAEKEAAGKTQSEGEADAGTETPDAEGQGAQTDSLSKVMNQALDALSDGNNALYSHTVNFQIPESPAVDILMIVDSSNSMARSQTELASNFESFFNAVNGSNLDFQIAITTMDICDADFPADDSNNPCPLDSGKAEAHLRGTFVGNPGSQVMRQGDPDLVSTFSSNVQVGVDGSDFEHGLKAAELAIQKEQSGENPSLLREGAFLSIFFVSDENDDGSGLNELDPYRQQNVNELTGGTFSYSLKELQEYLDQIKPDKNYSLSAITVLESGDYGEIPCTNMKNYAQETGTAYIEAAEQTGGIIKDLCDVGWADNLKSIGIDLGTQVLQIPLLAPPANPEEILVQVNSQVFHTWNYDEQTNSVRFDPAHVPAAFSDISIEFQSTQEP